MDIVSHGLWGGVAFGRKNKKMYWSAFGIGIAPDLLSFGVFTAANILGLASGPDWKNGLPNPALIPQYVHVLYNFTHSLVIFSLIFFLIWFLTKKAFLPLLAWPLHILVDIFSHSTAFFPTPFLWPLFDFKFNGISWGQPIIFYPNIILLMVSYLIWFIYKKRKK